MFFTKIWRKPKFESLLFLSQIIPVSKNRFSSSKYLADFFHITSSKFLDKWKWGGFRIVLGCIFLQNFIKKLTRIMSLKETAWYYGEISRCALITTYLCYKKHPVLRHCSWPSFTSLSIVGRSTSHASKRLHLYKVQNLLFQIEKVNWLAACGVDLINWVKRETQRTCFMNCIPSNGISRLNVMKFILALPS